jgi:hypothetical protein
MCDKERDADRISWERLDYGRTSVECIEKTYEVRVVRCKVLVINRLANSQIDRLNYSLVYRISYCVRI